MDNIRNYSRHSSRAEALGAANAVTRRQQECTTKRHDHRTARLEAVQDHGKNHTSCKDLGHVWCSSHGWACGRKKEEPVEIIEEHDEEEEEEEVPRGKASAAAQQRNVMPSNVSFKS